MIAGGANDVVDEGVQSALACADIFSGAALATELIIQIGTGTSNVIY
jgi:hypothetical protein